MSRLFGNALLLAASLLALAGCKKEEAPVKLHSPPPMPANVKSSVEGHIRYHGVGLASGSVLVYGETGDPAIGVVMMGGTYVVWDPPQGRCKVAVTTKPPAGLSKAQPAKHAGNQLPARYENPDTSGLTLVVTGGKQKFDIILED